MMFTLWRQPVEVKRVWSLSSYSAYVLVKTQDNVLKVITTYRTLAECLEVGQHYQFSFFYGEVKEV